MKKCGQQMWVGNENEISTNSDLILLWIYFVSN